MRRKVVKKSLLLAAGVAVCAGVQGKDAVAAGKYDNMPPNRIYGLEMERLNKFVAKKYWEESDVFTAKYFNDRARASGSGSLPAPLEPGGGDAELTRAYQQLKARLDDGIENYDPINLAFAQAMYDCWAKKGKSAMGGLCRACFGKAIAASARAEKPEPVVQQVATAPPPSRLQRQTTQTPYSPECEPQSYLVFFDFGQATVDDEARAVLDLASEQLSSLGCENATVEVIGHTDTVGSPAANNALSRRRAENAQQEIEQILGRSTDAILGARGESELRVPTGDGVNERENRRVEITIR